MIWAFLYDTDIHTAVNGCLTAASLMLLNGDSSTTPSGSSSIKKKYIYKLT